MKGLRNLIAGWVLLQSCCVFAGEVTVVAAEMFEQGEGKWQFNVTLRHADTGWEHYANGWRVVLEDGTVLGTRTLYHPHVNEQPFTRSLSGVELPEGVTKVWIEASDSVHGWSEEKLELDLEKLEKGVVRATR